MTRPLFAVAVAAILFLSACEGQTEPATDITDNSATLHGKGRCTEANAPGWWWYELNDVTSPPPRFVRVGEKRRMECSGTPTPFVELTPQPATGLSPETTYEFRVCAEFDATQGSTVCADKDGTVHNGNSTGYDYDRFTTSASAVCDQTVSSNIAGAVSAAPAGSTVCVADGSYPRLNVSVSKPAPGVTVRALNPGQATLAGASVGGSNVTVARFRLTGAFDVGVGSTGISARHNLFDLDAYQGYGVMACASTSTTCNDVVIENNRFVGAAEEDAIRANRYHDTTADADTCGLSVDGNEFTGNVEKGDHNDVFQSVWQGDGLCIRRNYLHDFGGQGIFVKDQASTIPNLDVSDNLVVRQNKPCVPDSLCPTWQLSPFQLFGPVQGRVEHNTVWPTAPGQVKGGGVAVLRNTGWSAVVSDNVIDTGGRESTVSVTGGGNSRCSANGGWLAFPGSTTVCSPAFADPAAGDYRLPDGRGVTWAVGAQDFGP